ncbi:unnamed protein product [Ostreobium quekettii]|uniref:Uncharacterized protein n=1 Tax=Ostreobium quekettii TaxID=121088 RepID=A0A8S1J161_9CHLO|nr:unnamed protein product [Ostreobium quekettii]
MHTLMYKRQGTAFKRKRDILDFSGFPYADEEAKASEMAKAEDKLGKWHMGLLNKLLDCFDLPRGSGEAGQKAYKVERAVEFLMKPKILGTKNKAEMEAKRKERMKKKQESAKKKKAKVAAGKDKGPKAQKRKHGEESKPRGRPPKKAKTVPEDHEEAMDDAEGAAADSAQANELTEEVVRNELMKMLKAADLNDLSLKKVGIGAVRDAA